MRKKNKSSHLKARQIARTAATLFFNKGYSQTTMREIGKACKISPGHLYYYIKSKEEFPVLFGEMGLNDICRWEKKIRDAMPNSDAGESLCRAVREYVYSVHRRRKMLLFWYSVSRYLKREQLAGLYEAEIRVVGLFREIIEEGCRRGEFKTKDPFLTAFHIEVACQTWALKRFYLYKTYTIERFADLCEEQALLMAHGRL